MASAWVHSVLCLISFGRFYFDLNKQIDSWSEYLGHEHRKMGHDYYQLYSTLWDMDNPFPQKVLEHLGKTRKRYGDEIAEREQEELSHSYLDRLWDDFSEEYRQNLELALIHLISNPDILKCSAGVDVIEGRIEYQIENGQHIWLEEPELPGEYQRFLRYTEGVLRGKGLLQQNDQ